MSQIYTIGELARAARVPTSTIRYYERRGLLRPSGRSDSNYRVYDAEGLELLRFTAPPRSRVSGCVTSSTWPASSANYAKPKRF